MPPHPKVRDWLYIRVQRARNGPGVCRQRRPAARGRPTKGTQSGAGHAGGNCRSQKGAEKRRTYERAGQPGKVCGPNGLIDNKGRVSSRRTCDPMWHPNIWTRNPKANIWVPSRFRKGGFTLLLRAAHTKDGLVTSKGGERQRRTATGQHLAAFVRGAGFGL